MTKEQEVCGLLRQGDLQGVERVLASVRKWDNLNMAILDSLVRIYHAEIEHGVESGVFDYSRELPELVRHFIWVKLLMRRLEFDMPREDQEELYDYCSKNYVSVYFLAHILQVNIFFQKKVCGRLGELYRAREGGGSSAARFFDTLLQSGGLV